jgi:hypothetical protein
MSSASQKPRSKRGFCLRRRVASIPTSASVVGAPQVSRPCSFAYPSFGRVAEEPATTRGRAISQHGQTTQGNPSPPRRFVPGLRPSRDNREEPDDRENVRHRRRVCLEKRWLSCRVNLGLLAGQRQVWLSYELEPPASESLTSIHTRSRTIDLISRHALARRLHPRILLAI